MLLIDTLASYKDVTIDEHMDIIRASFFYFISACRAENLDCDRMFKCLTIALNDRWGGKAQVYLESLKLDFDKTKIKKRSFEKITSSPSLSITTGAETKNQKSNAKSSN